MYPLPKELGTMAELKKRSAKAFERDQLWHSMLRDVYEYLLPQRDLFNEQVEGQDKKVRVYDSTATNAIKEAANKVQSATAPIWSEWAMLEPGDEFLQVLEQVGEQQGISEEDIRKDLERVTEVIFDHLNRSNFATQYYEALLDWLVGTGTLQIQEGDEDEVLVFKSTPQNTVSFEEGPNGNIETHWRKFKVEGSQIERLYKGVKLSSEVKQEIERDPTAKLNVVEGVVYSHKDKRYHGVMWVNDEDQLSWHFDYEDFNPWVTGRYSKTAGEIRGRGPGVDTLPDVRTLNKVREFTLQKAAIDVAGMFTATDDGVTNPYNIEIGPGVVIPVGSNNNANPSIQRLDTGTNLNLAMIEIEQLVANIKIAFFNDLRDPAGPVRSATEIAIESRELAQRIGSAFGRIQSEMLIPILNRVIWILKRRGLITIPKIDGKEIKIKFTSPLARAKDIEEVTAIQNAMEISLNLTGPELTNMGYKTEELQSFLAKKLGVPAELVRTDAEKAKIAAQATENAERAMESQNAGRS